MHVNTASASPIRWPFLIAGFIVFVSAVAYYVVFRAHLPWPGYLFNLQGAHIQGLTDISLGSYPSLAFTLSFGFWSIAIFTSRKSIVTAILLVWLMSLLHESVLGTFDVRDYLSGFVGMVISLVVAVYATKATSAAAVAKHAKDTFKLIAMGVVSLSCATATSMHDPLLTSDCLEWDEDGICIERQTEKSPVYLSYADLRSAVQIEAPRDLASVSRIYLYQDYLFINEQNEGIHVIDNNDPFSPQRIAFIAIPGNTEVSIRSDYLYADSYIDLVTLDVSDVNNIQEIAREESIFPYNARQNIPRNIRLVGEIDSSRGVVVGYR